MTQEEKQLLLKDLCGRVPYGIMVNFTLGDISFNERVSSVDVNENNVYVYAKYGFLKFPLEGDTEIELSQVKPYLRPMTSMTEEEKKEYHRQVDIDLDRTAEVLREQFEAGTFHPENKFTPQYCHIDWLNAHHFDYRGLIPIGLAIEATKETYE